MGDTVKLLVTESWVAVPNLVLGSTYSFQNVTDKNVLLRQQASTPDAADTGFKLEPAGVSTIVKEANDVWVRSPLGGGLIYYNEVT